MEEDLEIPEEDEFLDETIDDLELDD